MKNDLNLKISSLSDENETKKLKIRNLEKELIKIEDKLRPTDSLVDLGVI